ncbi:hypothetical protein [uncultured Microscilla sp.]|uniref:hypothetical protein n=1 Tax=uncultured Microscilla sp. TaxID=432653 RepID=UPI002604990B|nr:hypothetical protein [uncultured Microscilla sp.]
MSKKHQTGVKLILANDYRLEPLGGSYIYIVNSQGQVLEEIKVETLLENIKQKGTNTIEKNKAILQVAGQYAKAKEAIESIDPKGQSGLLYDYIADKEEALNANSIKVIVSCLSTQTKPRTPGMHRRKREVLHYQIAKYTPEPELLDSGEFEDLISKVTTVLIQSQKTV